MGRFETRKPGLDYPCMIGDIEKTAGWTVWRRLGNEEHRYDRRGLSIGKADVSKKQNTVSSESQNGLIREPGHMGLATMLREVATS